MTQIGDQTRRCGECTLCCTLMGVVDLEPPKEPRERCPNECSRGCRIYPRRPQTCRDFVCLWAQGAFPKWARPDKVGVVFCTNADDEQGRLLGFTDPRRPDAWRVLADGLTRASAHGALIVVGPAGRAPLWMFQDGQMLHRPSDLAESEREPRASSPATMRDPERAG